MTVLTSRSRQPYFASLLRGARKRAMKSKLAVETLESRVMLSAIDSISAVDSNAAEVAHVPDEILIGLTSDSEHIDAAQMLLSLDLPGISAESGSLLETVYSIPTRNQGDLEATSEFLTVVRWALPEGSDVPTVAAQISGLGSVAFAEPNVYIENAFEFVPNDPQYPSQYHHPLMGNTQAWDTTLGSANIIVGVTDTGVDWDHQDLRIWSNAGEIAGNGIDDDSNGFIDDIRGWDFASNDNNPDESGGSSHGTHVSGIAAGITNNATGIAGTSGGSTIMPIRISGSPSSSVYAGAFTYAANNGAHIVNTSFNINGQVGNATFTNAMQFMYDSGVLHFNSAGNANELNPVRQAFHQTLLVASTTSTDAKSGFSNYGTGVDIAAPGSSIISTLPNNTYGPNSGTSMAAPNAAGVAALIWSANPTWTRDQVAAQIIGTADNIDGVNPTFAGLLGSGRVNSFRGVTETLGAPSLSLVELPTNGMLLTGAVNSLTVDLDNVFSEASIESATNWELVEAGSDGLLGTADDVTIPISTPTNYMVGTNRIEFTFSQLSSGEYRFRAVSGGLEDPFGTDLDGNDDTVAGDDFVRDFTVDASIAGTPDRFYFVDVIANNLMQVDAASGLINTVGPLGVTGMSGLAWDPATQILFGSNAGLDQIYTIDLATGTATSLGTVGIDISFSLAFSPLDGFLYAVHTVDGSLVQINPSTLAFTDVTAGSGTTSGGLTYNPVDQRFYTHSNGSPRVVSFDAVSFAGPVVEFNPAASPFFGMTHDSQNLILAGGPSADENLYKYDPNTGAVTPLLATDALDGLGVNGVAWVAGQNEIHGVKFNDYNANGIQDLGEPGLAGWTIYIDENLNGQFDGVSGKIEPDDYPTNTVLDTIHPGVTLSEANSLNTPVGSVTAINGSVASTGVNSFGTGTGGLFSSSIRFRMDFNAPNVTELSLDFISDDTSDSAILEIYDAGNTLLGTYTTASLSNGQIETMTLSSAAPIAYAVAYGTPGQVIYFDNLDFSSGERATVTDVNGEYWLMDVPSGTVRIGEVQQAGWEQTNLHELGRLYTYDATGNLIREIDPITGTILNSFASPAATAGGPDMGLATTTNSVVVGGSSSDNIFFLNPDSGAMIHSIPNPGINISGLAMLHGELFVFTDSGSSMTVMDPRDGTVLRNFTVTGVTEGIGASGDTLYGTNNRTLFEIDPTTGATTNLGTLSGPNFLEGVGVIGAELYVSAGNQIQVFDLSTLVPTRTLTGLVNLEGVGADGASPFATVSVGLGQAVTGINFGNRRLGPIDNVGAVVNDLTDNSVTFFDVETNEIVATVSIPGTSAAGDVVITNDRSMAFVTNFTNTVYAIDLTNFTATPIAVSPPSEELSLTADGQFLLVSDGSATQPIGVVDIATLTEIGTFNAGHDINSHDVGFNGSVVFTSWNADQIRRLTIDGAGNLTDTGESLPILNPLNIYLAPDGRTGVATAVSGNLLSFATSGLQSQSAFILGASDFHSGVFSPLADRFYARADDGTIYALPFDSVTGTLSGSPDWSVAATATGNGLFAMEQIAISEDGSLLYVPEGTDVVVRSTADGSVVDTIPNTGNIQTGIAIQQQDFDYGDAPASFGTGSAITLFDNLSLTNPTGAVGPIASLVPNRFDFSDGFTGTSIIDGGNDMYDGGNQLNTNLATLIPYTNNTLVAGDTFFGTGSQYFTYKTDGVFAMGANGISINEFRTTGNNGADGSGTANATQLSVTVDGQEYQLFIKRVFGAGDPSINQMIIVPGDGTGVSQTFATNTNDGLHTVTGLSGISDLYYLLVARAGGLELSDADALTVASEFLGNITSGYRTLLGQDGARHLVDPGVFLGATIDADPNGQPDVNATGDDFDFDGFDEDGVAPLTTFDVGMSTTLDITASVPGEVAVWADWNQNGLFENSTERYAMPVVAGLNSLSIPVPATALAGNTYVRVRYSTDPAAVADPFGFAPDGEVEDYLVNVHPDDPDDQISEATPTGVGSSVLGDIDNGTDTDMYGFSASAGERIQFDIDTFGSGLDSILRLFDDLGNQLAVNDDGFNEGGFPEDSGLDSFIDFTFATAGTYYVGVSGFSNFDYDANTGQGDDDNAGTGTYTLNITNPPVVAGSGAAQTYREDRPPQVLDTSTLVSDPDSGDFNGGFIDINLVGGDPTDEVLILEIFGVSLSGANISVDGALVGTFASDGFGGLDINLTTADATPTRISSLLRAVAFVSAENAPTPTRFVEMILHDGDGGISDAFVKQVDVQAEPDRPQIAGLGGPVTFIEDAGPIDLTSTGTLFDPDLHPDWNGARLNVRVSRNLDSFDRLTIRNDGMGAGQIGVVGTGVFYEGTQIGTFNGGVGTTRLQINFIAGSTTASIQALIRAIQFENLIDLPVVASKDVRFELTDPQNFANLAIPNGIMTVNMQGTNDLPTIAGISATPVTYNEGGAPRTVGTGGTISDADYNGTGFLRVSIVAGGEANDRLGVLHQGLGTNQVGVSGNQIFFSGVLIATRSGGIGTNPMQINFNSNATRTGAQAVMRLVQYSSVSEDPSTVQRQLDFLFNDGDGADSNVLSAFVNVNATNDPSVIANFGADVNTTTGTNVRVSNLVNITDVDSPDFAGGLFRATISSGQQAGDTLSLFNDATVTTVGANVFYLGTLIGTLSTNATSLTVVLNASATATMVQRLGRNLEFSAALAGTRAIRYQVLDGDGGNTSTPDKNVNVS